MPFPGTRNWSSIEEDYLYELVGKYPIDVIAERLNRSEDAITSRMARLKINNTKLQSGKMTANELANLLTIDLHTVRWWMNEQGLPYVRKVTCKEAKYYLIDQGKFWKWANTHRTLINFAKVDPYVLTPQPDWVEEQRKQDYHQIPHKQNAKWTETENQTVISMYKTGRTKAEIAKALKRSELAIQRKISKLKESGKLPFDKVNLPWKENEVQLMVELERKGLTDAAIAYELGREREHIVDKRRRLVREKWYKEAIAK